MSVLLEKPIETQSQQHVLERPIVRRAPAPIPQPQIRIAERVVERTHVKPRTNGVAVLVSRAVLFGAVLGFVYAGSSLGGQVMVESARQQRIDAVRRAAEATSAVAVLNRELDKASGPTGVERWAIGHGFQPVDGLDNGKTLIAQR